MPGKHQPRAAPGPDSVTSNGQPVILYQYGGSQPDTGQPFYDPEKCGTYAGWNEHKRNHEQPCHPCLDAQAEYVAEWRLRTGRVKTRRVRLSAAELALLQRSRGTLRDAG